jgi:prepilin peptidase CpaA
MDELSIAPIALSLFGGVYDVFTKKIPNWLTFSGMFFGIATQYFLFGTTGLSAALLGIGLGFILFIPIYAFGYMGAGDVKLLMLVGAWVGYMRCGESALAAILFGGIFALFDTLSRGRFLAVVQSIFRFLRALAVPVLEVEKLNIEKDRRFSFGPCIAFGLLTVTLLHHWGRL